MGQGYFGVCIIFSVRSGREVLHLTCGSKLIFVGGYFDFMLVVMFQGLLHHLFVQLVKHVSSVIAREGAYAIEFSVGSHRRALSVGFWEGTRFVCMPMFHCGRDVPLTKSYIDLVSRLLSAISGDATIICCGGSNADFVKVLDKSPGRRRVFSTLLRWLLCSLRVCYTMGRIDMCSMLRALLLRLNALLDERWVQSTQYFRMVRIGYASWLLP